MSCAEYPTGVFPAKCSNYLAGRMAKLADAQDLKSCVPLRDVRVRAPLRLIITLVYGKRYHDLLIFPVNVFALPDADHEHDQPIVLDLIHDAIVADADTVQVV